MDVKKTVEEALAKPMNRREFLGRVGVLALSVVGVTALLRSLRESGGHGDNNSSGMSANAYGSSAYGGKRKS